MYIRYNQGSQYYEYDTSPSQDGSGPWLILPINGSQIIDGTIPWNKVSKVGSSLADLQVRSAADLSSGILPLARLAGITNTEIAALAGIEWSKINKTGSSLADLTTRSASDLSSGILPDARFSAPVGYTPTVQASGGGAAIGTGGTLSGFYVRVGSLIFAYFNWVLGTGFSFGAGTFGISLPFASATAPVLFEGEAFDVGVNAFRIMGVYSVLNSTPCLVPLKFAEARVLLGPTVPFTYIAGDSIYGVTLYRSS